MRFSAMCLCALLLAPGRAPAQSANLTTSTVEQAAQQRHALGNLDDCSPIEISAFSITEQFAPLPKPGPSDWLSEHAESGQTYDQYRLEDKIPLTAARQTLYIKPFGSLHRRFGPTVNELKRFIEVFFQIDAVVLPEESLDLVQTHSRNSGAKRQLYTRDIFGRLRALLPADGFAIIAVTLTDLYPGEKWNFVLGQASLVERIGVYSLARFFPSFYGLSDSHSRQLIYRRAFTVLAHEIGHTFGLHHCTAFHCLMNGSNWMDEIDRAPLHLCPVCLRKLYSNIHFDLQKHHRGVATLLQKVGLLSSASWHRARAKAIAAQASKPAAQK